MADKRGEARVAANLVPPGDLVDIPGDCCWAGLTGGCKDINPPHRLVSVHIVVSYHGSHHTAHRWLIAAAATAAAANLHPSLPDGGRHSTNRRRSRHHLVPVFACSR